MPGQKAQPSVKTLTQARNFARRADCCLVFADPKLDLPNL